MIPNSDELIAKVNKLKEILEARATYGAEPGSDEEYKTLRADLRSQVHLRHVIPHFLTTCRTLDDFWSFIKPLTGTYAERRSYLLKEFDPILSFLEGESSSLIAPTISAVLTTVDSPHVQEAWLKVLERRESDPEGAITSARTLLEAVCKHILEEEGIEYDDSLEMARLYKLTAAQLNLAPDQHTEQIFKQILSGCQSIVGGLAGLRNALSDAHGKGRAAVRPAARHAALAVNVAGAVAMFLIETWEMRRKTASS